MRACLNRSTWAVLLGVAGLLFCQPGRTEAHPHLVGPWLARVPPGGYMTFDFGVAKYIGNGCWRGPYFQTVSGFPASCGIYELQMYTGTLGTLALRENLSAPGWSVGNVDLAIPEVVFKDVVYKRQ
jgi:hypothetical protein